MAGDEREQKREQAADPPKKTKEEPRKTGKVPATESNQVARKSIDTPKKGE